MQEPKRPSGMLQGMRKLRFRPLDSPVPWKNLEEFRRIRELSAPLAPEAGDRPGCGGRPGEGARRLLTSGMYGTFASGRCRHSRPAPVFRLDRQVAPPGWDAGSPHRDHGGVLAGTVERVLGPRANYGPESEEERVAESRVTARDVASVVQMDEV